MWYKLSILKKRGVGSELCAIGGANVCCYGEWPRDELIAIMHNLKILMRPSTGFVSVVSASALETRCVLAVGT